MEVFVQNLPVSEYLVVWASSDIMQINKKNVIFLHIFHIQILKNVRNIFLILCRKITRTPTSQLLDHLLVPNFTLPSLVTVARSAEVPETITCHQGPAEAPRRDSGCRGSVAEHPIRKPQ